jgi:hypothetical protein
VQIYPTGFLKEAAFRNTRGKKLAILSVNLELLSIYWEIDKTILLQQKSEEGGR